MYKLNPPAIYAFETALQDPLSAQRIGRLLQGLGREPGAVQTIAEADIPRLVAEHGWQDARRRQGQLGPHRDPALVFAPMRFAGTPAVAGVTKACPPGTSSWLVSQLLGRGGLTIHHERAGSGRVCRSRYQFETLFGCPHGCQYCFGGRVAVIYTNLEEFVARQVIPTAAQNPWQKVFMFNSCLSDTLCFEPEYGLARLLAEAYAATADQYALLHTNSANVDGLLDLDHRGRTIVLWSLSSPTACRQVEPGTPTTAERIAAARRCQQAGYPVRIKFKPIVPVRGWRDECRETVAQLLAAVRPDNIGLCTLAWMDLPDLQACIGLDGLDPACVAAMQADAAAMKGVVTGPFPHRIRAEIYSAYLEEIRRHDRKVPVFLCTESPEMWQEFVPRLGCGPGQYGCACGPQCPPGAATVAGLRVPAECA